MDGNANCAACERNVEIGYYLKHENLKKAEELSEDIENFKLTCRGDMNAWLRMKSDYMLYYLRHRDFEKAESYCQIIERKRNAYTEFEEWDYFLYCYCHTNMGKH